MPLDQRGAIDLRGLLVLLAVTLTASGAGFLLGFWLGS